MLLGVGGWAGWDLVLPRSRPPFVSDGASSDRRCRPLRVFGHGGLSWQSVRALRWIPVDITPVLTAMNLRSPVSVACQRYAGVDFRPRRSGSCVPSGYFGLSVFRRPRPSQPGSASPSGSWLASGVGHHHLPASALCLLPSRPRPPTRHAGSKACVFRWWQVQPHLAPFCGGGRLAC